MKFLLLALFATSSYAANLQPKYECTYSEPEIEEASKVTIFVSEGFLCGEAGKEYEMAALTQSDLTEYGSFSSIDTGVISYSSEDMTITATVKAEMNGLEITAPLKIDLSKDGQENNSTLTTVVDVDEVGLPVYGDIKATCHTAVLYNMDC